jgi:hypothetical protein
MGIIPFNDSIAEKFSARNWNPGSTRRPVRLENI